MILPHRLSSCPQKSSLILKRRLHIPLKGCYCMSKWWIYNKCMGKYSNLGECCQTVGQINQLSNTANISCWRATTHPFKQWKWLLRDTCIVLFTPYQQIFLPALFLVSASSTKCAIFKSIYALMYIHTHNLCFTHMPRCCFIYTHMGLAGSCSFCLYGCS